MRLVAVGTIGAARFRPPIGRLGERYSSHIPLMAYTFNSLVYSALILFISPLLFFSFPFLFFFEGDHLHVDPFECIRAALSLSTHPQEKEIVKEFLPFCLSSSPSAPPRVLLPLTKFNIFFDEPGDHIVYTCTYRQRQQQLPLSILFSIPYVHAVGFVSLGSSSGDFTPCVPYYRLGALFPSSSLARSRRGEYKILRGSTQHFAADNLRASTAVQ